MEEFIYSDIKIGTKRSFEVLVSEILIKKFSDLTLDNNPLHMDLEYSSSTKFGQRIAHGFLLESFFSRLAGIYLPGKYSLILSVDTKFKNPCFIDSLVVVSGEVTSKIEMGNIIILDCLIQNQSGLILVESKMRVQVLK